jgi:hypothetical protein
MVFTPVDDDNVPGLVGGPCLLIVYPDGVLLLATALCRSCLAISANNPRSQERVRFVTSLRNSNRLV